MKEALKIIISLNLLLWIFVSFLLNENTCDWVKRTGADINLGWTCMQRVLLPFDTSRMTTADLKVTSSTLIIYYRSYNFSSFIKKEVFANNPFKIIPDGIEKVERILGKYRRN